MYLHGIVSVSGCAMGIAYWFWARLPLLYLDFPGSLPLCLLTAFFLFLLEYLYSYIFSAARAAFHILLTNLVFKFDHVTDWS